MAEGTDDILKVSGLHHVYKRHKALDGMEFTVSRRAIHGFVGPNGAGKTTTLKVIATLLAPQEGQVRVFGMDVARDYKEVRKRIGFMPDHFSMYRNMTVFEYLDFFAAAYGLSVKQRNSVIGDVLALTDMDGRRDDLLRGLSRGMQQRVSLARVLVHDPSLLLLDEPASGLDPRARIELMEILKELQRMGKTIFISSHILAELATLCDDVTIVDRGKVKYTGAMNDLLYDREAPANYRLVLQEPHEACIEAVKALPGMQTADQIEALPQYRLIFARETLSVNTIIKTVMEHNAQVISIQEELKHLNQAFMDLTQGGVAP